MEYQVIFERLDDLTDLEKDSIRRSLIDKFKVPEDKAEKMITAAPLIVKKGLTLEQAQKYKTALESIGARASLRKEGEGPSSSQPANTVVPPAESSSETVSTANVEDKSTREIADSRTGFKDVSVSYQATENLATKIQDAVSADPLKTRVSQPSSFSEVSSRTSADETPTNIMPPVGAATNQEEWWNSTWVLNPPYDENAQPLIPLTTGKISRQAKGLGTSHPMIDQIAYDQIRLIAVFQVSGQPTRIMVDVFTSTMTRPVRFDARLINFSSFPLASAESLHEQVGEFLKFLLQTNSSILIDLATYRFLKDKTLIKTVQKETDVERYVGKLQTELESGLEPDKNPNLIRWRDAIELLEQEDPWIPKPSPPQFQQPVYDPTRSPLPGLGRPMPPGYNPFSAPQMQQPQSAPFTPPFRPGSMPAPFPVQNPVPGQFQQFGQNMPVPPQGYAYPNPSANPIVEQEISRARSNAQTALILSIVGLLCGCLFPLSIVGLIKAQDALQVMDNYRIETDRNKAVAAKTIAIIGLVINALVILMRFLN